MSFLSTCNVHVPWINVNRNCIVCLISILHDCVNKEQWMLWIKTFTIENFAGALFLQAFYHVWVNCFFVPQKMSTRTRQIGRQSSENQILFQLKVNLFFLHEIGDHNGWGLDLGSLIVLYHLMVFRYRKIQPME